MRTTTILALVVSTSVLALAACGDASGTSASNYHPAAYNDSTGTDPTAGANNGTPAATDPTAPPAPPTTGSTPAQDGSFKATVDVATPTADLGMTSKDITVTVTPAMGFKGDVVLSVTGTTAGVTPKFDKTTVSITDTAAVTAKLSLVTAYATQADTLALVVTATSGKLTSTVPVNFKVNPQLTMSIPTNVAALEVAGGGLADIYGKDFGVTPATIPAPKDGSPITIKVVNLDAAAHIVHGNGAGNTISNVTSTGNFPHGNTNAPLAQGATDPATRTATAGNTYNGYLHDVGTGKGTGFAIVVGK